MCLRSNDRYRASKKIVMLIIVNAASSKANLQCGKMEQRILKIVNNCHLETFGSQSYTPYLNVVHFFNTRVN